MNVEGKEEGGMRRCQMAFEQVNGEQERVGQMGHQVLVLMMMLMMMMMIHGNHVGQ